MKLTKAQLKLLGGIDAVYGGLPVWFLKPATRSMVPALRRRGLISKRNRKQVTLTERGRAALKQKGEE